MAYVLTYAHEKLMKVIHVIHLKKDEWFSNIRRDVLAGIVVGLALIPESIAFSAIAGVDPQVGLYASFCIAVTIAFMGGRPAMISAATGAMALLMITLVKTHGLQYLLAATVLTGIIQIIAGYCKVARLMRFVSQSVVYGFVNALAILIFVAQLPELLQLDAIGWGFIALGLGIVYLFPHLPVLGQRIPAPLVCIVVLSALALVFGLDMRTVSDLGQLPNSLPIFLIPDIPFTWETLTIIFPYACTLAAVGLLETMMTTTIVNEVTETECDRHVECRGQGYANIVSGFMGGMAGCAMIGQSIINVSSGARTRLSTLVAGVFLLCLVVFLSDWLQYIPMAALVAVMIMVAFTTFNWNSIRHFQRTPLPSNIVMLVTVIVVLATHNLALGVIIGVLCSAIFLAKKLESAVHVDVIQTATREKTYFIRGQIFFSSAEKIYPYFNFNDDIDVVVLDLTDAHIWDITSVGMFDQIQKKFQQHGIRTQWRGLNTESEKLLQTYTQQSQ